MSEDDLPAGGPNRTLDDLLERYLCLLDEQQKLHEELGSHMSSGFFSLARANQSCAPGRRYGEDYYDERMKAMRTIEFTHDGSNGVPVDVDDHTKVYDEANEEKSKPEKEKKEKTNGERHDIEVAHVPSSFKIISSTPTDTNQPEDDEPEPEPEPDQTPSTPSTSNTHPLRWFGVLVPPSLRSAQESFVSAVEGAVPRLASVIAEMHEVEGQIRSRRG